MLQRWVDGDELEAIGTAFLAEIENDDYRAEALSEFSSGVFEHHLPWALGSLIAWINADLDGRGALRECPRHFPRTFISGSRRRLRSNSCQVEFDLGAWHKPWRSSLDPRSMISGISSTSWVSRAGAHSSQLTPQSSGIC